MSQTAIGLNEIKNDDWIRQAFFSPNAQRASGIRDDISRNKQYSSGVLSFGDTTLGGNRSMNPRPGFTEFADPNVKQIIRSRFGMGRYYHEAIDNNAQRIYFQFGVPGYNSLTSFFTSFYDSGMGRMANQGAIGGLFYSIGQIAGYMVFWPVISVFSFTGLITKAVKDAMREPLSRYYYVKPAMPLYWSSVTTIVNAITVNMGLGHGADAENYFREKGQLKIQQTGGPNFGTNSADTAAISSLLPDVFRDGEHGGIDIKKVATRYQRLADAHHRKLAEINDSSQTDEEAKARIEAYLDEIENLSSHPEEASPLSMKDYLKKYAGTKSAQGFGLENDPAFPPVERTNTGDSDTESSKTADDVFEKAREAAASADELRAKESPLFDQFDDLAAFVRAEAQDGANFVSFIVDFVDTVSESFSNSTSSSSIADQMNQTSSDARSKTFNLAGGNLGDGAIATVLEGMIGGAMDVVRGALDTVGLSGLGALGGAALVDIPDFWDSSSTQMTTNSYNIQLRSPYGNPISIMQNVMVPLAMLLAAAAPRSTGKNSYTGPYICKMWSKGRSQVQLGLIDSLSITRGTGNVGWNISDQSIGIDVSFSVINLSKILHMPISNEIGLKDILGLTMFDEDNNFTDYMAVLGSLGLADQYFNRSRWRLRRAHSAQNVDSWFSASNFISWGVNNTLPGNLLGAVARDRSI